MQFTLDVFESRVQVCRITGNIYLSEIPALRKFVEESIQEPKDAVVFDLTDVKVIDSSGINFFIDYLLKLKKTGKKFYTIGVSRNIGEVFRLTGLIKYMNVKNSIDEVLGDVGNG